jgi:hypothetical protein
MKAETNDNITLQVLCNSVHQQLDDRFY